jgi:hypothetical protein
MTREELILTSAYTNNERISSIIGKPIIASGWSGHLDFLTPDLCGLVGGTLVNVHDSAHVPNLLLKESQWFKPDDNQVGHAFLDIFDHYKKYQEKAKELSTRNKRTFSLKNMDDKVGELLKTTLPDPVELVTPVPPELAPKVPATPDCPLVPEVPDEPDVALMPEVPATPEVPIVPLEALEPLVCDKLD